MARELEYAGAGRRLAACFIDTIVVSLLTGLGGVIFGLVIVAVYRGGQLGPGVNIMANVLGLCMTALYYGLCESSEAMASPGKRAMGLQVLSQDGERLSFGQALVRWLFQAVTVITLFGLATIWFTDRRQTLHDILSRTVVVRA